MATARGVESAAVFDRLAGTNVAVLSAGVDWF
jgi:hypothetical protein